MAVNEISVVEKEGWIAVSILIDSGASDSVAPPGMSPKAKVLETNASRAGVQYTAAGCISFKNFDLRK